MTRTFAKIFLALLLLTGVGTVLSACNTTAGFGEDMSNAGDAVTNSAEKNK